MVVRTPTTPPFFTTSQSNQSLKIEDATANESVEMARPFLKGIEANSVLIDINGIPNQQLLRDAQQALYSTKMLTSI
ncbi:hypothetical protein MAM1_0087d04773 [Mucor ambiguus]|uniref:Uncharacterized protein n=1 Tax=Mucor ambiguus TaxID=91626 RepID=A0A0C9MTC7_9FUNG|nr:hypothetical protein MAM1_0087d04773 [Mucor ambiguus]